MPWFKNPFVRTKSVAPLPTDSSYTALFPYANNSDPTIVGHENYDAGGVTLTPFAAFGGQETYVAPNNLHSPFLAERGKEWYTTSAGKHYFDGADPAVERVPRSDLQIYFDQKKELPVPPALVPGSGVFVPVAKYNYGSWTQAATGPDDGMYSVSLLVAPHTLLNRPIHVVTGTPDVHRQAMKTMAPRQKRSAY
jgi:hypothetical protein